MWAAEGSLGKPGHGQDVAADGDHELGGRRSRRDSLTDTVWPEGAPLRLGSTEKLYWVLATQTGERAITLLLQLVEAGCGPSWWR